MHPHRLATALLLLGLPALTAEEPGSWPRFRGPNGSGIASTDGKLKIPWERKHVRWKAAIPGDGNGSPIVWGERIFLATSMPDGSQRHLLCLSVADGKVLWKKTYAGSRARTHAKNSLASATPCTDGKRVYVTVWDGRSLHLVACDFQGQEVWKQNLGGFRSQHGAGHSPIVHEGKVFLVKDHDQGAEVHAFDAATGKQVWLQERKVFNTCYSTPVVRNNGQGLELIVASTAGITGYDPDTGKVRWNWSWDWSDEKKELRTVGSPVLLDDMIVATSGDGGGARCTVAVRLGGSGELSGSALAWKTRRLVPYVPTLLAWQGHLYFVNDQGVAGCLNPSTGETLWSRRVCGPTSSSPILVDGKIIAIDEEGQAVFLQATPKECKFHGRQNVGEPVFGTPAVANGCLFIRGKESLMCVGNRE